MLILTLLIIGEEKTGKAGAAAHPPAGVGMLFPGVAYTIYCIHNISFIRKWDPEPDTLMRPLFFQLKWAFYMRKGVMSWAIVFISINNIQKNVNSVLHFGKNSIHNNTYL